jgi:peptide methionine sulfoxide reductase MsrA
MKMRPEQASQVASAGKHLVAHVLQWFHRVPCKPSKATFGAGCFWGVEEAFRNVKGVLSTSVGYAGGTQENPTYQDVCTDKTGHAEVVQVEFDPSQVSYRPTPGCFLVQS